MPSVNPNYIQADTHFGGTVSMRNFICPDSSIGADAIDASDPLLGSGMYHRWRGYLTNASNAQEGDETRVVGIVTGAEGTIRAFKCWAVDAAVGNAIAEFDLLVNGVSVLTGVVELNSADADYEIKSGVISTAAVVAEDVIEIELNFTVGSGTNPLGVGAMVEWEEKPV